MAGSDRDLEWLMAGKDVLLVVVLPLVNPFFLFRWPELRISLDMDVTLNKIARFIISTKKGPQEQWKVRELSQIRFAIKVGR